MGKWANKALSVDDLLPETGQDKTRQERPVLANEPITGAALLDMLQTCPAPRETILMDVSTGEEKPWLVRGKTGLLVAPGGGGKTGLLMQMAAAVATGRDWLGYQTRARRGEKVCVVLGEEDAGEVHRRLYSIALGLTEQDRMNLAAHLFVFPMYSMDVTFETRLDRPSFFAGLQTYLEDNGPWCLVIMDPASRFMGPDAETDNAAATRFVAAVERFTLVPGGPSVLLGHHTNKTALGAGKTDQGAARGSSALVDGVRWVCNLESVDDPDYLTDKTYRDWRQVRVVKTNYTARSEPLMIRYEKGEWRLVPPRMIVERAALILDGMAQGEAKKADATKRARAAVAATKAADAEKDLI